MSISGAKKVVLISYAFFVYIITAYVAHYIETQAFHTLKSLL
jgi:hypothetical protein